MTARKKMGGRRANARRRQYEATEQDKAMVRMAVAGGVPKDQIRFLIINPFTGKPISVATLYSYFRHELDIGLHEVKARLTGVVVNAALQGDVDAALRFLKARGGPEWNPAIQMNIEQEVTHKFDGLSPNKRLHLIAEILDEGPTERLPEIIDAEAVDDVGRASDQPDKVVRLAPPSRAAKTGT